MLLRSTLVLSAASLGALAQTFEPTSFNVTGALEGLGVDVTAIPALDGLAIRSSTTACSIACSTLKLLYSSEVLSQGTKPYSNFTGGYWSQIQEDVDPVCVFKPVNANQVSVLVLLSRLTQCPFAAKSGGHAAFAGASNIQGGITMSFENMKGVEVSANKSIISAQPGWRWGDLYKAVASYNIAPIGGRVYEIGTGGLTLGGGISFYSGLVGWATENVASYDVVTASGIQVTASPTEYSDLYWALRGGGNNFGLVTKFNYIAISAPNGQEMWGGTRAYIETEFPAVVHAFAGVVADAPSDGNAGQWVAWLLNNGTKLAATELWYAKPNGQEAAIFDNYNAITAVSDTTQNRKLYEYAAEVETSNPYGLREVYYCLTVKASEALATVAKDIFFNNTALFAGVTGANPVLLFQGITLPEVQAMAKRGGNPLGLAASDAPFYLIHVACWWENASDDATVYAAASKILTAIKAQAKSLGVQNDYLYMNYASEFEDVIASYGAANKARLKSIAAKYDPTQVFQTLQPGYFKLDRAPAPNPAYFSG